MPLALLITEPLRRLTNGVRVLAPLWAAQLDLDTRVLGRARSLYLVRWFSSLPLHGDTLLVWVDNLDALRARLGARFRDRVSLLDPAAGIAGTVTGGLVSPIGGIGVGLLVGRMLGNGWRWVMHALWGIAGALILGALVAGVTPFVALPLTGLVELAGWADVSGNVARLDALGRFADALGTVASGPPKHPVAIAALGVADELAALLAELLGAAAYFAVHIGPLLSALARQVNALAPLVWSLAQMAIWTYADTVWHLKLFISGRRVGSHAARLHRARGRVRAHRRPLRGDVAVPARARPGARRPRGP